MKIKILWIACFAFAFSAANAQDKAPENWFNLDKAADNVQGVSTEKTYQSLLKGRKSETVIVAVIDGGVDPEHEDLKDVMWVNPGEIAGNGKDDDGNGYIDDVHGWNFIGGKNGKSVNEETLEITRLVAKYRKKFGDQDGSKLSGKDAKDFAYFKKIEKEVEENRAGAVERLAEMEGTKTMIIGGLDAVAKALGDKPLNLENVEGLDAGEDQNLAVGMRILGRALAGGEEVGSIDEVKESVLEQIKGGVEYFNSQANYHYNPDFDPRSIVGDNYANQTEKYYGNNDIKGPDALHGTHVAGIIAAIRNNDKGMDGVADNVRIMGVRAVPNGDERDKDVANAIIYAVDNGASIINMSFGKSYSWNKTIVDNAVKYAEKHDVLLVHAAGNSSENTDVENNFPRDKYDKAGLFKPKNCRTWLEIGALSWKPGEDATARFSNFGKVNVDIFAPGVDIYATAPDGEYASLSGTSMASPVTAGVAGILRSYFPELSARQVKDIIMTSAVPVTYKVKQPGEKTTVNFSSLCQTGGIVSAYKAVELAMKTKGKRKMKRLKAGAKALIP